MLNFGILGSGRIGQVHARAILASPDANLAAVSDFFPEAAEALAAKSGAKAMTTEEILASADIDAVVIGTPTTTHYDLIHAAAANGKAIFCEKPIDLSSDRIRDCLKAIDKSGVPFMVAFNRRFDPNMAAMQKRIAAGEVGSVELLTILHATLSAPNRICKAIWRDLQRHDDPRL